MSQTIPPSNEPNIDFGFRDGFSQLGSYKKSQGLGFIYVPDGNWCFGPYPQPPTPGSLNNWILNAGPFLSVTFLTAYAPSIVNRYPMRGGVNAGETCSLPDIEALQAVAAGIAELASG